MWFPDASWNQKHLDYEIETNGEKMYVYAAGSWNQKHLDYEIETIIDDMHAEFCYEWVEIKSISITRLKHGYPIVSTDDKEVEIKSISITRLKL